MRTLLFGLLGIVLLAAIVVVAVPFIVSTSWIRDQVTAAVRDQTGRELIIAGDTTLSLFPDISLAVSRAALSNPPGRDGTLARMEELDLGLRLMPLLSGQVEVDRFVMTKPFISLEIDENGAANWDFSQASAGDGAAVQQPAGSTQQTETSGGSSLSSIDSVQLGDIRLIDGTITYQDQRTGSYQEARNINATVELTSLDDPLDIDGQLTWQGETLTFNLALNEPRALATGTPSSVSFSLEAPLLQTGFTGTIAAKDDIDAEGELEIASSSAKDLMRWLGTPAPSVNGLGAFSVAGAVRAGSNEFALSNASIALDDMNAEGGLLVALGGAKPLVQATLAVDGIDVNPYLGGGGGGSGDAGGGGGSKGDAQASAGGSAGWSREPINLTGLRSLDADLRLSTRSLRFQNMQAGQSALAVTLKDGILTVDLSELQLYEGRAVGKLTVNASNDTPALAMSFSLDEVAALPLLRDVAQLEWLEGRGQLNGALASRGGTQEQLVGALNGDIALRFTDGAIRGFNVAQMVRGLSGGGGTNWARDEAQKTDFSEFTASFVVNRGIAQTSDLQMLGPLVRLNGAGVANLPARTVDFRINPKIVASLEGQGGAIDLSGLEIPILIRGPWDQATIAPDLEAVIRDPQGAIDTIEQIGESLKNLQKNNGDVGDVLNNLTGGQQPQQLLESVLGIGQPQQQQGGGQGGGDPQAPPPISEDVFNRLLGR